MNKNLVALRSIEIEASPEKLWEVLTQAELIKIYLYGTETITDWQVGSPIIFQGTYNEMQYKDKGNVLESIEHKLLRYNYWSGFSGLEDKLENYSIVTYEIHSIGANKVQFSWHQQGFGSEEGRNHTEQGLINMLEQIKTLAEK